MYNRASGVTATTLSSFLDSPSDELLHTKKNHVTIQETVCEWHHLVDEHDITWVSDVGIHVHGPALHHSPPPPPPPARGERCSACLNVLERVMKSDVGG